MTYKIPCPHETNPKLSPKKQHPDYHPLTRDAVRAMLITALAPESKGRIRVDIQCRLCQAIPGTMCPSSIDDENAQKDALLNRLYVNFVRTLDQICLLCDIP